jgi:mRNA-degrading endonuclease RelE of RelBE toxin-antitoxin system
VYEIELVEDILRELKAFRAADRSRVLDQIEQQLSVEPDRQTRRRKILVGLTPPWDQLRPVWQLRIGDFRVFYDIDEPRRRVIVRAVRRKGARMTREVL